MHTTETQAAAVGIEQVPKGRLLRALVLPSSIVRCVFYAFVFSLPFEKADIEIGGFALSRLLGFLLVAVTIAAAFLQKRHFRFLLPPKAFWFFVAYFIVYVALGYNMIVMGVYDAYLTEEVFQGVKTLTQLLIFFWISYNLLQYDRIRRGVLLSLAGSCIVVAILQALGLTDSITAQTRTAAFGANENLMGEVLSIGLLIVVGLTYGRDKADSRSRLFFWPASAILALMIVITGSRGAMIGVFIALLVFFLNGRELKVKLRVGVAILVAVGLLGWASYAVQPVRERWERTYYEGDTAGRDIIFATAWEMFLEKPVLGWGPKDHISVLGARVGYRGVLDTHNIYLWLLTETGLVGATFFIAGLWLCCLAAWQARNGSERALPMSLLTFLLINGMKGTNHTEKLFWIILAYAVASASVTSIGWKARIKQQAFRAAMNSG
jgi:O-antigen ligase